MIPALQLNNSIEDVAKRLGRLYARVKLSRDPMFSWLHITNDATILGEDLRRYREKEAAERAGKILIRLLEFLGYYLYCHRGNKGNLSDLVADTLRKPSYKGHLVGLEEGPSRWILFKYPHSCPKCGYLPCHCMVWPEIFENRREAPEGYLSFAEKVVAARTRLAQSNYKPFTLRLMFSHFRSIYYNNYCYQDPWKIGMHLNEEIGEATTELSRMNLQWRAQNAGFPIRRALEKIFEISESRLTAESGRIKNTITRKRRRKDISNELALLKKQVNDNPWEEFGHLVGEKFKEEVSDVFSWLVAVILRLDPKLKKFKELLKSLSRDGKFGEAELVCKYCRQPICTNDCLVTHGISAEITEKLSKF